MSCKFFSIENWMFFTPFFRSDKGILHPGSKTNNITFLIYFQEYCMGRIRENKNDYSKSGELHRAQTLPFS